VNVGAPEGPEAVGDLSEDDAGSERAFGAVVGGWDLAIGHEGEELAACKGRSKFRPLRRHKIQASSTGGSKSQKVLNACLVWVFNGIRSGPVTAAVTGFSSATWPEFGPPYTVGEWQWMRPLCSEAPAIAAGAVRP